MEVAIGNHMQTYDYTYSIVGKEFVYNDSTVYTLNLDKDEGFWAEKIPVDDTGKIHLHHSYY